MGGIGPSARSEEGSRGRALCGVWGKAPTSLLMKTKNKNRQSPRRRGDKTGSERAGLGRRGNWWKAKLRFFAKPRCPLAQKPYARSARCPEDSGHAGSGRSGSWRSAKRRFFAKPRCTLAPKPYARHTERPPGPLFRRALLCSFRIGERAASSGVGAVGMVAFGSAPTCGFLGFAQDTLGDFIPQTPSLGMLSPDPFLASRRYKSPMRSPRSRLYRADNTSRARRSAPRACRAR